MIDPRSELMSVTGVVFIEDDTHEPHVLVGRAYGDEEQASAVLQRCEPFVVAVVPVDRPDLAGRDELPGDTRVFLEDRLADDGEDVGHGAELTPRPLRSGRRSLAGFAAPAA